MKQTLLKYTDSKIALQSALTLLNIACMFSFLHNDLSFNVKFYVCITLVLILYAQCMLLSGICMDKFLYTINVINKNDLTKKQILTLYWYMIVICLPLYFFIFIVSIIPIFEYEVWFMTAFPAILLSILPMSSVVEECEYYIPSKLAFWVIQLLIAIGVSYMGQSIFLTVK